MYLVLILNAGCTLPLHAAEQLGILVLLLLISLALVFSRSDGIMLWLYASCCQSARIHVRCTVSKYGLVIAIMNICRYFGSGTSKSVPRMIEIVLMGNKVF